MTDDERELAIDIAEARARGWKTDEEAAASLTSAPMVGYLAWLEAESAALHHGSARGLAGHDGERSKE